MKKTKVDHYTDKEALEFHSQKKPGKIEIIASKSMITKRDLALAYSPGVAVPVKKISEMLERDKFLNPNEAKELGLIDEIVEKR